MNKKEYVDKIHEIKNEILDEIRTLIPEEDAHYFDTRFNIHYVDGDVVYTDECVAVGHLVNGEVSFLVRFAENDEDILVGNHIYAYDTDSFFNILKNLKKEIRNEKLSKVREILTENGNEMSFDGTFKFSTFGVQNGKVFEIKENKLCGIKMRGEDILLKKEFDGEICHIDESALSINELDSIVEYLETKAKMKKFTIRVSGSFSRCFDIEAKTYEDAVKEAKALFRITPLNDDDSNGENWDGYEI